MLLYGGLAARAAGPIIYHLFKRLPDKAKPMSRPLLACVLSVSLAVGIQPTLCVGYTKSAVAPALFVGLGIGRPIVLLRTQIVRHLGSTPQTAALAGEASVRQLSYAVRASWAIPSNF